MHVLTVFVFSYRAPQKDCIFLWVFPNHRVRVLQEVTYQVNESNVTMVGSANELSHPAAIITHVGRSQNQSLLQLVQSRVYSLSNLW